MDCKILIRAHEQYEKGFAVNFPNLCYTVHTAPVTGSKAQIGARLLIHKEGDGRTDISIKAFFVMIPRAVPKLCGAASAPVESDAPHQRNRPGIAGQLAATSRAKR